MMFRRGVPRRWAVAGAGAAGAVGAAVGVAAAFVAREISGPQRPLLDYAFTPYELQIPWEDVRFEAADGARLSGWWFDRPGSDRVVIVCHGHRGSKQDMLGIGPGLWRAGNAVLLFDFRGNGESGDGLQSLAHHEQADLEAAVDLVRELRPDARLEVVGFSMGAAITTLVAARRTDIEAVVLDSPFAEMRDVIGTAMRRKGVPTWPVLAVSDIATRALYKYRYADVRPVAAIGRISPRPLLILHGTDDHIIPVSHAHQLYAAAGEPKELVIFDGVDHCGGYFDDRPAYIDLVAGWLERSLPGR